ncbi:hypothetical protein HN935_01855 [archaeon]|nr:hypothetical protein [archaeon]
MNKKVGLMNNPSCFSRGASPRKKGQVTIFIIIAIVIVSAVLIFFLWLQPTYFSAAGRGLAFENCVEDSVEDAIGELEKRAGFINPEFTYAYNGEEMTYLCYTNAFYETCSVQVPFLKTTFDEQMELLIRGDVDACYDASVNDLKSRGYDVTSGAVTYDVVIEPGAVRVLIDAPTTVGATRFTRFNVNVNSPVYDMVMIATSILQFETKYGDSDTGAMMVIYPDYIIDKIKRSDGTTIYILEHKDFGNKFQFASRSLAWPSGYDA